MPDLDFTVLSAEPAKHAAVPTLYFKLAIGQRIQGGAGVALIQNVALQCQFRIDCRRRLYAPEEKARLSELFGAPDLWSRSLQSMLWTHTSLVVPAFGGDGIEVDLPVSCSFDFNLAATKYFDGLQHADIPLLLLFSGSIFYRSADGALEVAPISWNTELRYALPLEVWRRMMDIFYPNCTWLSVSREVFDSLYEHKRRKHHTGFDETLSSLLPAVGKAAAS